MVKKDASSSSPRPEGRRRARAAWRRRARLGVLAAALLLVLAACGGGPTAQAPSGSEAAPSEAAPVAGGTLTLAMTDEPDTLDPAHTVAGPSEGIFYFIYDTLVARTADGGFEGDLASDWSVSDDAKTWTFHLRPGLVFSNGDPLDADAVVFTFQRILDPATQAPSKGFLGPVESVEKVDDSTVVFHLAAPSALLLDNLAISYFGIVDPKAVQAEGDGYGRQPVGSGPFMLKEWATGDHITLVPNPNHKEFRSTVANKGRPYLDAVVFRIIPQVETQLAALESGEIDAALSVQGDKAELYQGKPGFQVVVNPASIGIEYIFFAMEKPASGESVYKPPFDDIRVRQAVGYALDVPGIIQAVLHGYAVRNCTPMPTGVFAYDPDLNQTYCYAQDTAKAGELLDAAGWTLGADGVRQKDGKPLHVEFWALDADKDVAQVIQSQLQAVGFQVDVKALDVATYVSTIGTSGMNLGLVNVGWSAPNILDIMATLGFGFGLYNRNGLPEALAKAGVTVDEAARRDAYVAAQKIILDDAAIIPLYSPEGISIASDKVMNFKFGPDSHITLPDVWLKR
ncbi:MAG: ABC transporter substrate-binding protein [Clostridia bacterium]|nr:ABC transporter substrate-binding protein [Clostridia bacterium]